MATDVIMPALGMAQETGTLLNWLKFEGEPVKQGEPLMEVETDKATVEIEAPASGILARVTASAGDKIPVGQRVAIILAPGEATAQEPSSGSTPKPLSEGTAARGREATETAAREQGQILASPAAKRIAREKGVELSALKGSGPGGSITAEDVLKAAKSPSIERDKPKSGEILPLTSMRRLIGERMTRSKQIAPHFYVSMDADMTRVTKRRAELKEKGENSIPSINDFILWASARALKDFRSLNSRLSEHGIEILPDINIGVAIALEDGIVAPVIRNADRLSLEELSQKSRELAEKADKKKLIPKDYEGGSFTVSNLGMFGVDSFIAIINPPQCAILAVGRVSARVVPQGDEFAIRSLMTMTLSADHRIVDGAVAARFLQKVRGFLENV